MFYNLIIERLTGSFFYQGALTGPQYLDILENNLPPLVEDICITEQSPMWWQQNGALPHNHLLGSNYFNSTSREQRIKNK